MNNSNDSKSRNIFGFIAIGGGIFGVLIALIVGIWDAVDHEGRIKSNESINVWLHANTNNSLFRVLTLLFILVITLSPFIWVGWRMLANNKKKEKLLQTGVKARAKIIAVQDTGMTMNNSPYVKITVEIKPGLQTSFKTYVSRVGFPRPGDEIEILYDPSNPSVVMPAN